MTTAQREPAPGRPSKPLFVVPASAGSDESESWVMAYLDVITLVLTLFVVLVSLSSLRPVTPETAPTAAAFPEPAAVPHGVDVVVEQDRISFHIRDHLLFASGEAVLTPAGLALLAELYPALADGRHPLSVEGHTDDVPITRAPFPSNWELSTARATSVVRELIALGVEPERLRAIGYADTRPAASNDTAEGRARNRRVGLILHLAEDLDQLRPMISTGAD